MKTTVLCPKKSIARWRELGGVEMKLRVFLTLALETLPQGCVSGTWAVAASTGNLNLTGAKWLMRWNDRNSSVFNVPRKKLRRWRLQAYYSRLSGGRNRQTPCLLLEVCLSFQITALGYSEFIRKLNLSLENISINSTVFLAALLQFKMIHVLLENGNIIINGEKISICTETAVVYFKVIFWYLPKKLRKITKTDSGQLTLPSV